MSKSVAVKIKIQLFAATQPSVTGTAICNLCEQGLRMEMADREAARCNLFSQIFLVILNYSPKKPNERGCSDVIIKTILIPT